MQRPVDVVIADKNPLVLSGLKQLFAEDKRFRVIATATDGERFLAAVERLAFDVGVIGWVMPYVDGAGILKALRERPATEARPAPRIVVYTGAPDGDIPRQAMALGGAAFVTKKDQPERLLEVVAAVAGGQMIFPLLDVRQLYDDPMTRLTPRERDMLEALSGGATNGQIAKRLAVSVNTVKFHLKNLDEKCQVKNRAQAVAFYLTARHRDQ
jgi:DNA-binding NarL/FixJ family response regulator